MIDCAAAAPPTDQAMENLPREIAALFSAGIERRVTGVVGEQPAAVVMGPPQASQRVEKTPTTSLAGAVGKCGEVPFLMGTGLIGVRDQTVEGGTLSQLNSPSLAPRKSLVPLGCALCPTIGTLCR